MLRKFSWRVAMLAALTPLASAGAQTPTTAAVPAEPAVHPTAWPTAHWPRPRDPALETRIAALLARMTLAEKVGQVIQADIGSVTPDEARQYHLGSILNGGSSGPGGDDLAAPARWLALADAFWAASVDKTGGRTGVPIIWGTDAVHGHSNIVGATLFPHNIGLGAARDPALVRRIGAATAAEVRTTGQEWTFAPTLTVPQDYRWGRAFEGYSSDPALVSAYAGAMVRGLQGDPAAGPLLNGPYVLASTKHFIADGGTTDGRDQGDAAIGEDVLRRIHGAPYGPAIEAGVGTIMASFSSWQGAKISGNRGLITDVLKQRMDFGGFVVTDWNAHGQVAGCTNASCPAVLNAGVDMYMAPDSWRALYTSLLAQAQDGTVPLARLDDAVLRILRVKGWLGLLDAPRPSARPYSGRFDLLGSPDHRAIAREAVAKSLVLLKNAGGVLPLRRDARILVTGDAADDLSRQAGGWTLSWQGTGVTNVNFPGATSIWAGIAAQVKAAGGTAALSADGSWTQRPDAAIVVFGETPYAEFQGDLAALQLRPELRGHLATMRRLKAAGVPVIAVMLTGRPLFVNPELNLADALVVAWLPGSEGEGVADGLFGATRFTGRLPTRWPRTARADGPTLYPFGYGLDARHRAPRWRTLPEASGVTDVDAAGVYFDAGVPAASWSLQVTDGATDVTRITTVPAVALAGGTTVTAIDHSRQEGARRFVLGGGRPQVVELSTHAPVDLTRETNGDVMLVAEMRIDAAPAGPVALIVRCGASCTGQVTLPPDLPVGQWRRVGVPLKCFAQAGATMARVDAPFQLATRAALTFSLARVALGTQADVVVACSR